MKSLREVVNLSNLNMILSNLEEHVKVPEERTKFKNYAKTMRSGSRITMYAKADHGKGRLQSMGSHIGGFSEDIKILLTRGLYHDIDIANCHPVLLLNLCVEMKWPHVELQYYIANREQVLADIVKCVECTRKEAKTLILILTYGGGVNNWKKDINKPNAKLPVFIPRFKRCLATIANLLDKKYPNFPVSKKSSNKIASKMSMYLQDMEHTTLMVMDQFFDEHGYEPGVYMFDGLMVHRKDDEPISRALMDQCQEQIKLQTGWSVTLEEKEI